MARFELATSSLPRRHTAGLCHIGIYFWHSVCSLTRENALQIAFYRLLNNVVSNPYKTLRKDRGKPGEREKKDPGNAGRPGIMNGKFSNRPGQK
jgi:hypothetical protein